MQTMKTRTPARRGAVIYLRCEDIAPNPVQPRKQFDPEALEEMSRSIQSYGVLNPLTVRYRGGHYELVAGERRLRAAGMAGLTEVPCILMDVDMRESSVIALIENLQRQDLNFVEEARGIKQLIGMFAMSQEEAARRLGRSQSAIANKLRLLKLPPDVLDGLLSAGLTERHGRALLRLPYDKQQRQALQYMAEHALTAAAADEYVDKLLSQPIESREPRRTLVVKDVKLFLNTISRSLQVMKQGGIDAGMTREETDEALILTISIPKARSAEVYKGAEGNIMA